MKADYRSQIKILRGHLTQSQVDSLSNEVSQNLEKLEAYRKARVVLLYWPLPGEVDLRTLIEDGGKRVALPVVVGDRLVLREYSPSYMTKGAYGILEPDVRAPEINPQEVDIAIIPGVAFDHQCKRLGRGKGFYDRLLPSLQCMKVGVAFSFQVFETIPSDPWDIPMDMVITENEVSYRKV